MGSLNTYIFYKTLDPGSRIFLFAVGFSALGALVFLIEWSIQKWFNYYDLSHVLLTVAAILFCRGSCVIITS